MESFLPFPENITPQKAIEIQNKLKSRALLNKLSTPVKTVAGGDISFNKQDNNVYAGIVTLKVKDLTVKNTSLVITKTQFPYIPGHLITFEDLPYIMELCDNGYKLPEPTRQAHIMVNKLRRGELNSGFIHC